MKNLTNFDNTINTRGKLCLELNDAHLNETLPYRDNRFAEYLRYYYCYQNFCDRTPTQEPPETLIDLYARFTTDIHTIATLFEQRNAMPIVEKISHIRTWDEYTSFLTSAVIGQVIEETINYIHALQQRELNQPRKLK